jgi:hypothetical protein
VREEAPAPVSSGAALSSPPSAAAASPPSAASSASSSGAGPACAIMVNRSSAPAARNQVGCVEVCCIVVRLPSPSAATALFLRQSSIGATTCPLSLPPHPPSVPAPWCSSTKTTTILSCTAKAPHNQCHDADSALKSSHKAPT